MKIRNADAQIISENFFDLPNQMYGYITADGIPLEHPEQVNPGDLLTIRLADGKISAQVTECSSI